VALSDRHRTHSLFDWRIQTGYCYHELLLNINCNRPTRELNVNANNLLETLLLLVDNVASESVHASLMPDESLLISIRAVEGDDEWNGIPAELKMKHLDHVLRIAESLPKT
jgi:hypothetical protein